MRQVVPVGDTGRRVRQRRVRQTTVGFHSQELSLEAPHGALVQFQTVPGEKSDRRSVTVLQRVLGDDKPLF